MPIRNGLSPRLGSFAHLRALLAIDGMMDQKFDREIEALIADQRVGLKAADLVLREHRIEVIGAGREYRLSHTLLIEHQGRKRERPGSRLQLLSITSEGGFAGAQRVGTMTKLPAIVE